MKKCEKSKQTKKKLDQRKCREEHRKQKVKFKDPHFNYLLVVQ